MLTLDCIIGSMTFGKIMSVERKGYKAEVFSWSGTSKHHKTKDVYSGKSVGKIDASVKAPTHPFRLDLRVEGEAGMHPDPTYFKIKHTTKFERLFVAYCEKHHLSICQVSFSFERAHKDLKFDTEVLGSHTPKQHHMKDNDVIKAMIRPLVFEDSIPFLDLRGNNIKQLPNDFLEQVACFGGSVLFNDALATCSALSPLVSVSPANADRMQVEHSMPSRPDPAQYRERNVSDFLMAHGEYAYSGALKGDKEHGAGTRFYADGCMMKAVWADGSRCGKAICTWQDGERWEVEYHEDQVAGAAKGVLANGDQFEGNVKESVDCSTQKGPQSGDIVTITANVRGAPPGMPALAFHVGSEFEIVNVISHEGAFFATNTEFDTLWFPISSSNWTPRPRASRSGGRAKGASVCVCGEPVCVCEEEEHEELSTLTLQPSGNGIMIYKEGSRYEGHWNDGIWHGQGSFEWPPHTLPLSQKSSVSQAKLEPSPRVCYVGNWDNGKLEGSGILTWAAQEGNFVGTFKNNCPVKGVLEMSGISCAVTYNCKVRMSHFTHTNGSCHIYK